MTCIIDKKYIQEYESIDSFVSYEMEPITVDTLRFIGGYFYKVYMIRKLHRWNTPKYGFKGRYEAHWSRLNEREMKKACYLGS